MVVLNIANDRRLASFYETTNLNLVESAGIPYIKCMEIIFIETPEFIEKFDRLASDSEMREKIHGSFE